VVLGGLGAGVTRLLYRHTGTWRTGGVFWVLPILCWGLAATGLGEQWPEGDVAKLSAGLLLAGLVCLACLLASADQALELYEDVLVRRKWGRARRVSYRDVAAVFLGFLDDGTRKIWLWPTPRTLTVRLTSGEEIEMVEMTEHVALAARLDALVKEAHGGGAAAAATPREPGERGRVGEA
jgi:hypothetical protein